MAAKVVNTRAVPKNEFAEYRDKGLQFYTVMKLCLEDREWDAVFLMGVHATISMSDAITVCRSGQRSTGESHREAATLLEEATGHSTEGAKYAARFLEIIRKKHEVAYEPRRFTEREAAEFAKQVERFVEWVKKQLP